MDCEWGDWKIGECSVTCGIGSRPETREKTVEEQNGGVCIGESSVNADCEDLICPGNVALYLFSSFT